MSASIEPIVAQQVAALGLELFSCTVRGSRQRPVLDVRIDHPDGRKVTVGDCATASKAIERALDEAKVAGDAYVLEVSSPGMERPLRHAADWRRFVGRLASVNSPALGGRREGEIVAVEGDDGAEVGVLRDAQGEHRVPLADVKDARLAFHWKR
jgi:ribosome maturation factor RimP